MLPSGLSTFSQNVIVPFCTVSVSISTDGMPPFNANSGTFTQLLAPAAPEQRIVEYVRIAGMLRIKFTPRYRSLILMRAIRRWVAAECYLPLPHDRAARR